MLIAAIVRCSGAVSVAPRAGSEVDCVRGPPARNNAGTCNPSLLVATPPWRMGDAIAPPWCTVWAYRGIFRTPVVRSGKVAPS